MNLQNKKVCYFIQETVKSQDGQFIPCIAVEGESGYFPTDWLWGKDIKIAEQCADEKNAALGISKKEAIILVLQSMRKR